MTPKEKAEELVDKMYNIDFNDDAREIAMRYPHAIKCASVDEILASKPNEVYKIYSTWIPASTYWIEVKTQIEKL